MEKDMTVGKPGRVILDFTIPVFAGNVFQQIYNMADTIIVGRFVGNEALAAVGACGTLLFLIVGFLIGTTAGFSVVTSRYYGAGDLVNMRRSVVSASVLALIVSVILTAVSLAGMETILHWMHTPENMYTPAYQYMIIMSAGIAAQMLYNLLASILRAIGDSRRPLYFLILAAALNIVLDLVFILVFHLGTAGAALATVVSQGVSGVLCLVYIVWKVPVLHLRRSDLKMDWNLAGWQSRIGFPMAFQYSITGIGIIVVQSALNMLGSVAAAGFAAASKIEQIVLQAYAALGTTMATYCAQNHGAGKLDRIRSGFRYANKIGCIYAVVTGILVFFAGKYMTVLFVAEDLAKITVYVDTYLKCAGVAFIPLVFVNVYRNGLQGMGYAFLPMLAGIAELVGRSSMAIVASYQGSYPGVCLASPAAWVLAGGLLIVMYRWIRRRERF